MTTVTPAAVEVVFDADVYRPGPGWLALPVENIVASIDLDRVPYCQATLTLGVISQEMWEYLDARYNLDPLTGFDTNIRFRIRLLEDGVVTQWLGAYDVTPDPDEYAELHVRSATRDYVSGIVTVECSGREALMDDKKSIRTAAEPTGATTVLELVEWSLLEVFGSFVLSNDAIVASTSIPVGDRRNMDPGESHSDLIEPELAAINCRMYDYWGHAWRVGDRDTPPNYAAYPGTLELATYTQAEGAPADHDPIVFRLTQTVSRDGDWADGVLVKFDRLDSGGTVDYQIPSGGLGGANTRGQVVTWQRPKPTANAADQIKTRSVIRGREHEIEARARFDVFPSQEVYVAMPDLGLSAGTIRAIEWDGAAATMRLRCQTGDPV